LKASVREKENPECSPLGEPQKGSLSLLSVGCYHPTAPGKKSRLKRGWMITSTQEQNFLTQALLHMHSQEYF